MEYVKHPDEVIAMLRLALGRRRLAKEMDAMSNPSKRFCYDILVNVSRSFAAVIMELDPELRDPVYMPPLYCICDRARFAYSILFFVVWTLLVCLSA